MYSFWDPCWAGKEKGDKGKAQVGRGRSATKIRMDFAFLY